MLRQILRVVSDPIGAGQIKEIGGVLGVADGGDDGQAGIGYGAGGKTGVKIGIIRGRIVGIGDRVPKFEI